MGTNRSDTTDFLQKKIKHPDKKITVSRSVEKDLKDPEKQYTHIFEHSPIMVFRSDHNGTLLDVNKAGVDLLGYDSRSDMIGLESRYIYADLNDRTRLLKKIDKHDYIQEFETRFLRKDGRVLDVQISIVRRKLNGRIDGYEGFVIDITGRKKAERDLIESEEKYRTVAENSLSAIFIHQKKRFCYANQRFAELLGYDSPEEIIGKAFWVVVHPEDRPLVKERGLKRTKKDFYPHQYPIRALKKDGSSIWVELRATHASYMGQPSVIGNFIDITHSKKAEEEIRLLTHRLIEAGEKERKKIAADIHDELGQALTSLHLELEAIERTLPSEAKDQTKKISTLIDNVEKLADTVRKTTSYIRPDVLDHLGLIPALEWYTKEFMQRRPDIKIKLEVTGFKKRLNPETETVLYRFCQECLTNVKKHAKATIVRIMLINSYPWIIFIIKDNGIGYKQSENGLPKNIKSRGIGLPSIKERVAALRGNIDILSAPDKGTTIRIELPLTGR